jgi:hypothetical protein
MKLSFALLHELHMHIASLVRPHCCFFELDWVSHAMQQYTHVGIEFVSNNAAAIIFSIRYHWQSALTPLNISFI